MFSNSHFPTRTATLCESSTYLVRLFIYSVNSIVAAGTMRRLDLSCQETSHKTYHRLLRKQVRDSVVFYFETQAFECLTRHAIVGWCGAGAFLVTKCYVVISLSNFQFSRKLFSFCCNFCCSHSRADFS